MKKTLLIILSNFIFISLNAQTVFWTEDFNNGCTDNCTANGYTSANGTWTVANGTGNNGNVANEWFISCAENGQAIGACGAGCGSNATLHIGNVPCTLCFVCPNGDCGAAYNAGPTFGGQNPSTDKRAISPDINTIGKTNITLAFKYIENGQGATDDASVDYSTDGGVTWTLLANTAKTSTCGGGQGQWTAFTSLLPAACENILNLKIAFRWKNNADGTGSDPSVALDDATLSVPALQAPVANFSADSTVLCDSGCVNFTDLSSNAPTAWQWSFTGAVPSSSTQQNPVNICYTGAGTYPVSLTVTNAGGSDSITQTGFITVNACNFPVAAFSSSDTVFCEKDCIDFADLSTNSPTTWQWNFPGAVPSSSTQQNPLQICYNNYGTYTVTLTVTNASGTDSITYTGFIVVNQNPAVPVIIQSADTLICTTPATSYQWYNGVAAIAGANSQTYVTGGLAGIYYVVIADSNGCTAPSNSIILTGINHTYSTDGIEMMFDAGSLIFSFAKNIGNMNVEITDVSGRIIKSVNENFYSGKKVLVRLADVSVGIYIVRFSANGVNLNKKIYVY